MFKLFYLRAEFACIIILTRYLCYFKNNIYIVIIIKV